MNRGGRRVVGEDPERQERATMAEIYDNTITLYAANSVQPPFPALYWIAEVLDAEAGSN